MALPTKSESAREAIGENKADVANPPAELRTLRRQEQVGAKNSAKYRAKNT